MAVVRKTTSADRLLAMREQYVTEQIAWHKANNKSSYSEETYALFSHALGTGWTAAVNAAKLHKLLKE